MQDSKDDEMDKMKQDMRKDTILMTVQRSSGFISTTLRSLLLLVMMTVHVGYEERLWREMLGDMPEPWVKTTQKTDMRDSKCYDLSDLPALYLLDADRKIMVRASYAEQLIEVLQKLW